MKKILQRWLGIAEFDSRIFAIEKDKTIQQLQRRVEELECDLGRHQMYTKGLIDYLDVEFTKEIIPHPAMLPPQPETMPILKATKRRVK